MPVLSLPYGTLVLFILKMVISVTLNFFLPPMERGLLSSSGGGLVLTP